MSESLKSELSQLKRGPNRGHYDQETVYQIIDDAILCHIGQQVNGQVFVTPTCHWRDGDYLYWHAHSKARNTHGAVKEGNKVCINICQLDGLVLARSAFHHSVNYRSVSLFGVPEMIEDFDEKMRHFELFINKVCPNRWNSLRPVTAQEIKATALTRIKINEASAKVRTGGPIDDDADMDWPVWAGVMPLEKHWGTLIKDELQTSVYPEPKIPDCN